MNPDRRRKLEEQLSAYLDGELTAQEQQEVEAFLAQDPQSRVLLQELETTANTVRSLPRAKASEELMEGIRARLERRALLGDAEPIESLPPRSYRYIGRWIAAAAVIVLSFTAAYMMRTITDQDIQPHAMREQFTYKDESNKSAAEAKPAQDLAEKKDANIQQQGNRISTPQAMRADSKRLTERAENLSTVKDDKISPSSLGFAQPSSIAKPAVELEADQDIANHLNAIDREKSAALARQKATTGIRIEPADESQMDTEAKNLGAASLATATPESKHIATRTCELKMTVSSTKTADDIVMSRLGSLYSTEAASKPLASQPVSAPTTTSAPASKPMN